MGTHLANGIQPKQMQRHLHHAQLSKEKFRHPATSSMGKYWKQVPASTDLGITDHQPSGLSWSTNVEDVAARRNRTMGFMSRSNGLVDINPASFFRHSDPKTRGAQRLHAPGTEPTPCPVFHSFFPRIQIQIQILYSPSFTTRKVSRKR